MRLAETVGFEPTSRVVHTATRLANERDEPLCHVSVLCLGIEPITAGFTDQLAYPAPRGGVG